MQLKRTLLAYMALRALACGPANDPATTQLGASVSSRAGNGDTLGAAASENAAGMIAPHAGAAAISSGGTAVQAGTGARGAAGSPSPGSTHAPSTPDAQTCASKPGKLRGKSTQQATSGGLPRGFIHYAPTGLDPRVPAPVVIVAHGFVMSADQIYGITRYAELAERERFVVMFPEGQPLALGPWNVGNPSCVSTLGLLPLGTGDDQAFIDDMLAFAETDQCIDHQHVFVAGFSMGGYFANETGCVRPDVRAIAAHSGGSHDLAACPSRTKPALIMHFNGDALIPTECGRQTRDRWLQLNHCQPDNPEVRQVRGGRCEYARGCAQGGQVAYCAFDAPPARSDQTFPAHAWSGGDKDGPAGAGEFAIPETENATELSWKFFKEFAW